MPRKSPSPDHFPGKQNKNRNLTPGQAHAKLVDRRQFRGTDFPHRTGNLSDAQGNELHLSKDGKNFARQLPTAKEQQWRMEYFHQEGRWEHIDFCGTLEECLAFLAENTHYLFWEE